MGFVARVAFDLKEQRHAGPQAEIRDSTWFGTPEASIRSWDDFSEDDMLKMRESERSVTAGRTGRGRLEGSRAA